MKLKIVLHKAEEGGYWAEVPALKGCFTQGETKSEIENNIVEAISLYLDEPIDLSQLSREDEVIEVYL